MPYTETEELPARVKSRLPLHAQEISWPHSTMHGKSMQTRANAGMTRAGKRLPTALPGPR